MMQHLSRRAAMVTPVAAAFVTGARAAEGAPVRRGYVTARTGQIHYRAAGEKGVGKRPMICLHPSLGSSLYFQNWIADLGRDRLAIAADSPGYGMSDLPAAPPTVADYAHAIGDLCDQFGLTDLDLVGAHTGSLICVEFARQRPSQVKHVILVTASVLTEEDVKRLRQSNLIEPPEDGGAFMARTWERFAKRRDPRTSLEDVLRKFPDHLAGGSRRIWGQSAAFSYPLGDTIGEVTAPILILAPGGDLHEPTMRAAKLLRHGKLVNRADWTSEFMQHDTAAAAALVRPFLDQDKFPD